MRRWPTICHVAIAVLWIGATMIVSLRLAMVANQEAVLISRRKTEAQARAVLEQRHERVRSALDWEANQPALEDAVRRLGLPLHPPAAATIAPVPSAPIAAR